ncbi:hypothetical protein D8674_008137 [Pyrus ussuriensis x Pyrus communis]|uniref:Uncharacterized protein n=1 Tax=Pyrus ussuriensis x Pyrus communis TaxID=2448454 RepID=A0A5N5HSU2_9ROSA|nr:hypothetical protein D8674_008137 [Pyrus ussuriensis x Pyrus communis]
MKSGFLTCYSGLGGADWKLDGRMCRTPLRRNLKMVFVAEAACEAVLYVKPNDHIGDVPPVFHVDRVTEDRESLSKK